MYSKGKLMITAMIYIPNMLRMTIDDDVISNSCIVSNGPSTRLLQSDVLWTDGVFQSLRRLRCCHCRFSWLNHLVVDAFIACDVNRKRIIAQRLHFVDCQVAVWLIRQSGVFTCSGKKKGNWWKHIRWQKHLHYSIGKLTKSKWTQRKRSVVDTAINGEAHDGCARNNIAKHLRIILSPLW